MTRISTLAIALAAAVTCSMTAAPARAAGTVQISFTQPERYTDAGLDTIERQRNLKQLAEYMQAWAERLPTGQQLDVEVMDVDLAGEQRLNVHYPELRVLRGRVDWPRMQLKWTLRQGAQTLRGGEEHLADMAYLMMSGRLRQGESLSYERRMLDDWADRKVFETSAGGSARR